MRACVCVGAVRAWFGGGGEGGVIIRVGDFGERGGSFSLPLCADVARQGDAGVPYVVAEPASEAAGVFRALAEAVAAEVGDSDQWLGSGTRISGLGDSDRGLGSVTRNSDFDKRLG